MSIRTKLVVLVLASCTILFAVLAGYQYVLTNRIVSLRVEQRAQQDVDKAAARIESILAPTEAAVRTLAALLTETWPDRGRAEAGLRRMLEANPGIYGAALAVEAQAGRGYAPYYERSEGKLLRKDLNTPEYDYPHQNWYQQPRDLARPVWVEPYMDEGGGNVRMTTFSVPLYREQGGERVFGGVLTADMIINKLVYLVDSIKPLDKGEGFLLSDAGTFIAHKDRKLLEQETILSLAESLGDASLRETGLRMLAGQRGVAEVTCPRRSPDGSLYPEACWIAYAPLAGTGWTVGVMLPRAEVLANVRLLNYTILTLGLGGLALIFVVILEIAKHITGPLRALAGVTRELGEGRLDFEIPEVPTRDEVWVLARSFAQMRGALREHIERLTRTTAVKERMEGELRVAGELQRSMVPARFPAFPGRDDLDVFALLEPARGVGGDLFDYFLLGEDRLCFFVGDVSDKGVPAALFMARTHTLMRSVAQGLEPPEVMLQRVNGQLVRDNDACMFVTLFCGVLDLAGGRLHYANAGHCQPVRIGEAGGAQLLDVATGTALGLMDGIDFPAGECALVSGDSLLLYTDGVTEALDEREACYTEERLVAHLGDAGGGDARDVVLGVLASVRAYADGVDQSDDIAIVCVRYVGDEMAEGGSARGPAGKLELANRQGDVRRGLEWLSEHLDHVGAGAEFRHDATLALDEVLVNVVSYGYEEEGIHGVVLEAGEDAGWFRVCVTDSGRPFNPLEAPTPHMGDSIEDLPVGGLGIFLVRQLCDAVEYARDGDRNVLTLAWELVPERLAGAD